MTQSYRLPTARGGWGIYRDKLAEQFQRWGVRDWEALCIGRGSERRVQSPEDRRVTVRWTTPGGNPMQLTMDRQPNALDNLRVLTLAVEALRLNEKCGISETLQEAYAQLPAPRRERDPFEVLGLVKGHEYDLDEIKAMYRVKAKKLHPDTGGDVDAFKELQAAYQAITGEAA